VYAIKMEKTTSHVGKTEGFLNQGGGVAAPAASGQAAIALGKLPG
jgi:hypothetical protein